MNISPVDYVTSIFVTHFIFWFEINKLSQKDMLNIKLQMLFEQHDLVLGQILIFTMT